MTFKYHFRIIESVRLRRNGFSFSLPQTQFLNRYKILSLKTWPISHLSVIENIQYLLHDLPIPAAEFAFGTTKMFIRSPRSVSSYLFIFLYEVSNAIHLNIFYTEKYNK